MAGWSTCGKRGDVAPGATGDLTIVDFGAAGTNPGESGVLLLLNAGRGDTRGGALKGKEGLQIQVAGGP